MFGDLGGAVRRPILAAALLATASGALAQSSRSGNAAPPPPPPTAPTAPDPAVTARDVPYGADPMQFARVYRPAGASAARLDQPRALSGI